MAAGIHHARDAQEDRSASPKREWDRDTMSSRRSNSFRGLSASANGTTSTHRRPSFTSASPITTSPGRYVKWKIRCQSLIWRNQSALGALPRRISNRPRFIALLALAAIILLVVKFKPNSIPAAIKHVTDDDQALEADRLSKPKIDQNGNEIVEDPYFTQPDIQRSFEEPDYALLSSRQPHEIGCDVPIRWNWNGTTVDGMPPDADEEGVFEQETGVLLFLGVFSAAQSASKTYEEMKKRRDM